MTVSVKVPFSLSLFPFLVFAICLHGLLFIGYQFQSSSPVQYDFKQGVVQIQIQEIREKKVEKQETKLKQLDRETAPITSQAETPKRLQREQEEVIAAKPILKPIEHLNQPPAYPRIARERGWEGEVLLVVEVSSQGNVRQVQVSNSSGYRILDEAAVSAVKKWQFHVITNGSESAAYKELIPVTFRLR